MKPINKKERDIAYRHYQKWEKWLGGQPSYFQKMIVKEVRKRLEILRIIRSVSEKIKTKN